MSRQTLIFAVVGKLGAVSVNIEVGTEIFDASKSYWPQKILTFYSPDIVYHYRRKPKYIHTTKRPCELTGSHCYCDTYTDIPSKFIGLLSEGEGAVYNELEKLYKQQWGDDNGEQSPGSSPTQE